MPEELIRLTPERYRALSQAPVDAAQAQAALMIQRGVDPAVAMGHVRMAVEQQAAQQMAEAQAREARRQQPDAQQPPTAPAGQSPPAPVVQQATAADPAPPLAAPGTPSPHEIPVVQAPGESLGQFWARRGAAIHQARQVAAGSATNLGMAFGLKPRR